MSSTSAKFLQGVISTIPLPWFVIMPLLPSLLGTIALTGYLVSGGGTLAPAIWILIGVSLAGGLGLAWLATILISQRLQLPEPGSQTLTTRARTRPVTVPHQMELQLHRTQQWLQCYSELSPGHIYTLVQAPAGHCWFEYLSLAVAAIYEITAEQALQDATLILNAIHPEDRDGYETAFQISADTLGKFGYEWRIVTPSGQIKWLQGRSQPDRRPDQAVVWHGVVIDITERKQAEAMARQSEYLNQAVLNAIPDLIIRMDRDGTYLDIKFTDAFPIVLTPQDVGRNILDLIPVDIAQERLAIARTALATQTMQVYEAPFWVGEQFLWEEVRIVPLNADQVVVIIRDLSQRLQIEEALRLSKASLLQAQHIAQVGSWELDPITRQVEWSEQLLLIFGLDPDQIEPTYQAILERVPVEEREMLATQIEAALTTHSPYELEHRIQRPDGTLRWVISKGQMVGNSHQQRLTLCGTILDITERKQIELALQNSKTRFQEIAQTLNQVSYVISLPTGEYLYISPAYEKLWGYSCESLYQDRTSWLNRIHPDDLDYVLDGLNQLLLGNQKRLEYRIFDANGEIHWIVSDSLIVYDDQGQPLRVVGLADDITERKQVETALRDQEAMLRAIGDNLPKGFIYQFVHHPQRGFYYSYISAGVERITGFSPEAVLQNSKILQDSLLEEDWLLRDQLTQQSLETLSLFEMQMRVRSASGEIRWLTTVSVPRRMEDGSTVWDGVSVDITGLKQAEAALSKNEELFRRAFDDAPIGISLISPEGKFLRVNNYYCNLLEYTEAELLQMNFKDITHPADLEEDLRGLARVRKGEIQTFQMEKRYLSKRGVTIPVALNASFVRDVDGNPLYSIGHIQDIRGRLEIDRLKDEFVSIVSHELRTPITSIEGALILLGSGVYDTRPAKAKTMLQIAIKNSNRLVRLVDDILSFERLESGKVQLVMESCSVEELMFQAIDSVQMIADQASIHLSMTSLPGVTLLAAPDALVQTLINLLSNAIKFSLPGNTVWLEAKEWSGRAGEQDQVLGTGFEESGTQNPLASNPQPRLSASNTSLTHLPAPLIPGHPASILFSVRDQGRGIPAEKLESIFEQFQQVDVSDSRQKGGTGLGLTICKQIVEKHGGQIWVESHLGKGSTFCFTMPLYSSSAEG